MMVRRLKMPWRRLYRPIPAARTARWVSSDAAGRPATHTGGETLAWSGHRSGHHYSIQGNLLAGAEVILAMEKSFVQSARPLAERILAALAAGEAAGDDRRGRQGATLVVVETEGFPYVDLRVDDHTNPLNELQRLYEIRKRSLPHYHQWVRDVLSGERS